MTNPHYTNTPSFDPGETASGAEVDAKFSSVQSGFDSVDSMLVELVRFTNADFPANATIGGDAAFRAGKLLAFDQSGDPELVLGGFAWKGDWAQATSYNVNDVVRDAAGAVAQNNQYRCKVAHISTTSFADDVTANYWEVYIDVADVKASEDAAATSETNAAASAAAAATSETNAATSETNAAASAASIPTVTSSYVGDSWNMRIGDLLVQGGRAVTDGQGQVSVTYGIEFAELPFGSFITGHNVGLGRGIAVARGSRTTTGLTYYCEYADTGAAADSINTDWVSIGRIV